MGSQAIQAQLWGRNPQAWSSIQEATCQSGYDHALQLLQLTADIHLLDVGCGSGLFCSEAYGYTKHVTGFDATPGLLEEARKRAPALTFINGDMEALPFPGAQFDVVTGFNSFQFAADVNKALAEAARVLKPRGRLIAMIWGNKADCEATAFLAAVDSLLPPPPPGAPGPFALSEDQRLEKAIQQAGLTILTNDDVPNVWEYPDLPTALDGLLSAGPSAKAIAHSGYDKVRTALSHAVAPFTQDNGHVVFRNKFRVVMAQKA
ncbi:hypothetical protein DCC81_21490 [Chitinophaga parva]|uniref:Methyltransferase type 11 domain-containing protein n=1 Tax=Chitinophaga parva TaxID=2169414 RepID=A0A2T7BD09_9BACT|nr:class I SAM-dependent methyltransferase [Chitinophaga parva]PUZ22988.1 hypothetical protein DCC81_21490 [Chitinophaga parva]